MFGPPQLDRSIPARLTLPGGRAPGAALASHLLDCDVVRGGVPVELARDPWGACKEFLQGWVREELRDLRCLRPGFRLYGSGEDQWGRSFLSQRAEQGEASFVWFTDLDDLDEFVVGPGLEALERAYPRLGATVLSVLERTCYSLLPVFTPSDALGEAQQFYWYGEENEAQVLAENCANDEERKAMLDEMVTRSMFDEAFPKWAIEWRTRRKCLSMYAVAKLAANARSPLVRKVAACVRALDQVDVSENFSPEFDGWFLAYSAVLSWKPGDLTTRVFDDMVNHAMEAEYVDLAGVCPIDLYDWHSVSEWIDAMKRRFQGMRLLDTLIHDLSTGDWSELKKGIR